MSKLFGRVEIPSIKSMLGNDLPSIDTSMIDGALNIDSISSKIPKLPSGLEGITSLVGDKVPNITDFMSELPTTKDLLSKIPGVDSLMEKLPNVDDLKNKVESRIGVDLDIFDSNKIPSNIDAISDVAKKVGININTEKVKTYVDEIDEFKTGLKTKALDGVKDLASKHGINIPNIPSEDELVNMIVESDPEDIESLDKKLEAVTSFINSKLHM